jgi:Caspase domain
MRNAICVVLLALGAPGMCLPQTGQPAHTGPNKLALVIGIDSYEYPNAVSPLAGSVNDVEAVKALLIGKFDFPPENILVLENKQATHAAIISAFKTHLIAKAQKGDVVVVEYSGHGSLMKAPPGKKISGLDETIVPYDSRDPMGKVFDIPGSELHALLRQLSEKTSNITFILDSCHSGTLVRGARVRSVPPDTRTPPPLTEYPSGERGLHEVESDSVPPFALIAASTSKESAFEQTCLGGREHGALTCSLIQQLQIAKPNSTWRDVMDPVISNVTAEFPAQHPQLEGAKADQQIFGAAVSLSQSYVPASPLDRTRITLAQGAASGMTAGSTFDIYRPGTKQFKAPEKPTGTAQIVSVGDFTSEARLLPGGSGPVLPGSRAIERIHRYEKSRLRLYLHEKEKSNTLQALSLALVRLPEMEIVTDPARCNLQLEQTGGAIAILSADHQTRSKPVSINSADAVDHLVDELRAWARWYNVLAIKSAFPGPDIQVNIAAGQGEVTRDPFQNVGKADAAVMAGDKVSIRVMNNSARDLYITILDLSTDGSISIIYPDVAGASEVLKPSLSILPVFEAFVPADTHSVTDTLKVFASTGPIDLRPLARDRIRGADDVPHPLVADGSDPLNDLLAEAGGISRGLRPEGSSSAADSSLPGPVPEPAKVANWNTAEKTLLINGK